MWSVLEADSVSVWAEVTASAACSHLRVVLRGLPADWQLLGLLLHWSGRQRPPGARTGLLQHDRWVHHSPPRCHLYSLWAPAGPELRVKSGVSHRSHCIDLQRWHFTVPEEIITAHSIRFIAVCDFICVTFSVKVHVKTLQSHQFIVSKLIHNRHVMSEGRTHANVHQLASCLVFFSDQTGRNWAQV